MFANKKALTGWVLLPLFFVLIIDAMGMAIVLPIIGPLFMDQVNGMLAAGASQELRMWCYGLTLTVFFLLMFIGAPFLGDLSDKYGRRKIILLCLLLTSLSYILCAISIGLKSVFLLLFGRALAGFMAGSQPIAQAAIIDVSAPEDKAKNIGTITMASCLGFVVGPLLGGFFSKNSLGISWMTYSTGFYIAACLAFINGVFVWLSFKETSEVRAAVTVQWNKGLTLLLGAFKNKNLRVLSLVFGLSQLAWGLYFQFVSIFFISIYHYSSMMIGLFIASMGVIFGLTLTVFLRFFMRFFSVRTLAWSSLLMMSAGLLLNILFHQEWLLWATLLPIILGVGVSYATLLTLYSDLVPADKQGWVMGVSSSIAAISWIIGGLITGMVGIRFIGLPFVITSGSAFIGFCLLFRSRHQYKKH
jgi:MFS family permease